MKTKLLSSLVLLLSTSFLYAQQFEKSSNKELISEIKCYSSGKIEDFHVPARNRTKSSKKPTAIFEITYTGFSDEAKAAFQAAADIWSNLISSPVPITIDAHWEVMESGVLGSSGSPEVFKNFKNAPFKDTWYKPSIANRLSGYDLNPEAYDMITKFNSDFNWYLGTDGVVPNNQTDFVTIVLHEIAHSLGFNSNAYKNGVDGGFDFYDNDSGVMYGAFDHFLYNDSEELLIDSTLFENPSPELLAEFTSNDVFLKSPLSNAANGDTPAELFAPYIWNPGSSISHLAESFNGTVNALMTYSLGTGESEHDPGPIVMGMIAEQGWVSVRFDHDHLKDIETWSAPITVSAKIFADTAIYDNSVFLHYSTDNFATETKVLMTTINDTLFTYDIPVITDDTVWYYIEAKSKLDRYFFYPSQGEGSINATFTGNALYFIIGNDNENPELIYKQEVDYILNFEETFEIEVEADDNMGIDSVYIKYKIHDNTLKSIKLPYISNNPIGLPKYGIDLPLSEETLNDLDTLYYKFIAIDKSSNTNSTILPESGYYKLVIHEIHAAEANTIIDFDETEDERLFILDGFTINQPINFNSKGLHSPHPYIEGDGLPNNIVINTATLKTPIILADTTIINFDEIVLVEPGSSGSHYGDDDFWDYVIIEGSKDSGKTWYDFADGYDCSIDPSFTTAYNINSNGINDMYISHKISLLENRNFAANDNVLIRFRLWSDQFVPGWGWAIDNIKIQKDAIAPTAPSSLEVTELTDSTVNLIWLSSTDNVEVIGYLIYNDSVFLEEISDTTYKATGLTAATTYSFFVKAKDAAGNISKASNTINPVTAVSEKPTAPTSLTTTEITDSTVSLIWLSSTDNVEVTGYMIYKNNVLLEEVTDTIYKATELTAATTYSFYIKSKDDAGNISKASNTISPSTTDSEIPSAPSSLTTTEITDSTISLIWLSSADNVEVTAYIIYKNNVFLEEVTDTIYKAIELTTATTYSFYIKSKDDAGNISKASNTINPSTTDSEIPSAPTSLTATEITDSTISLIWLSSTDNVEVTGYIIYKNNVFLEEVTDTIFIATELSAATTYSFYIKAKDAADNLSELSNIISPSTTDSEIPSAPTSLTATEITDSTISLNWSSSTDNVEVSSYMIYKNNILLEEVTDTIFIATELTTATTYSFFVKAKDAANNISEASNTINPSTKNTVGINMFTDNNIKYFKIYPNPNNGYFNMEFESDKIISKLNISIYSIDGKLVYSSDKLINDKFIKEQINVKNMNTGIYIIKLNTGKDIITERLLIK